MALTLGIALKENSPEDSAEARVGELLKLDSSTLRHWFLSYIEILRRLKLWESANEIIKRSADPAVRQMNMVCVEFILWDFCNNKKKKKKFLFLGVDNRPCEL